MGCVVAIPAESIAVAWWKYLKILVFCRFGRFLLKSCDASYLTFSDSFLAFRLFASVFRFCQHNVTRNDTRCEALPASSR
jgi:hypothetical protein